MDISIHASFLPNDDPDASLGLRSATTSGYGGLRWIKVGPADQTGTSIVLQSPAPLGCGVTDEERRMIVEMMAKGTYADINLATTGSRSGALE
jgi:hypothetical protein